MILAHSYIKRKKWEAELTAAAVVNQLAEAMGDQPAPNIGVSTPNNNGRGSGYITLADGRRARVVSPEAFIQTVKQR